MTLHVCIFYFETKFFVCVCVCVSREVKAVGGREIIVFKSQHFQICYVKNRFAKPVKLLILY